MEKKNYKAQLLTNLMFTNEIEKKKTQIKKGKKSKVNMG